MNVREKAKQLVTLLKDEERLREERIHALKTKEKMAQTSSGESHVEHVIYLVSFVFILTVQRFSSVLCGHRLVNSSASSAPSAPSIGGSLSAGSHSGGADPDQAWPQSSGEEDLQLQLALAMSKEEAEQVTHTPAHSGEGTVRLLLPEMWIKTYSKSCAVLDCNVIML